MCYPMQSLHTALCNIFTTKVLWSILACAGGSPSATCKEECSYNRRSAEVKPVFDLLSQGSQGFLKDICGGVSGLSI